MVLAGFMLGIAGGARFGSRLASTVSRPLYVYAGLELTLGVFALGAPSFLGQIADLARPELTPQMPWFAFVARLVAALCLIAIPCLVMGATLPLLLAARGYGLTAPKFVGILYGVNTLGATLASLLTGFYGVANWGISGCSRGAAAYGATAATLAMVANFVGTKRAQAKSSATDVRSSDLGDAVDSGPVGSLHCRGNRHRHRVALAATFVSGFGLLAAEVFWARILTFVFGHDTYAFATLLGLVLSGLALGGLCYTALAERDPWRTVGWAMALSSLTSLGSFLVAGWLVIRGGRDPFALGDRFVDSGALSVEMLREFAYTPVLAFLPCLCSGIAYPATIALFAGKRGSAAEATGMVGWTNGIGATLGATLTSIGLVSWLGIQGVLSMVGVANTVLATSLLFTSAATRRETALAFAPLLT